MVSVVIPVFNAYRFLNKCINSVVRQTYTDLEIILVNDGATDSSGKICDEWQTKDHRIIVIHKENEGVSIARNVGMECATGEYLCFVDADDFLPENSIEALITYMIKANVDLCCGSWTKIGLKKIVRNKNETKTVQKSDTEGLYDYLNIEEVNGPVAKIYRFDIVTRNSLQFIPQIKIGEDAIFNYQYIEHCRRVAIISSCVYYYNKLNIGSATHEYYAEYNKCCLLSAIAQVKALGRTEGLSDNMKMVILCQNIFCKRFLSAIYYLSYYQLSKENTKHEIQRTIQIFSTYLDKSIIYSNDEEHYLRVREILSSWEQDIVPKDLYFERERNIVFNFVKKIMLRAMVEYKISMLIRGKLDI